MATTKYQGNCHCGKYRFEVAIEDIKEAVTCTCNVCTKKGSIWIHPVAKDFKVVKDDGLLKEYDNGVIKEKFCGNCASVVSAEHVVGPLSGKFCVNVRTIREPYVNPFQLESFIEKVETQDERTMVSIPESEPKAFQLGACNCKKVQVELLVPLEEQEVKEDNCSSCVRVGYIGVYPTKEQVRIHGREHTFEYTYGKKMGGIVSCNTCGVHIFRNVYGPPISIFDRLPPERKEFALSIYRKNMAMQPLNVRAFEGVDPSLLKINRSDEGTEGYVLDA